MPGDAQPGQGFGWEEKKRSLVMSCLVGMIQTYYKHVTKILSFISIHIYPYLSISIYIYPDTYAYIYIICMWNTISIIHRCKDISTVLTQTLVPGPSQMRGMRHGFSLQRREGQVAAGHVAGSIGRMQLQLGRVAG